MADLQCVRLAPDLSPITVTALRCVLLSAAAAASAGASTSAGGLSAEEMQAAMQSVEDETDQAAAQALQQETEAELAEFNADPAPKPLDHEGEEDDNDAEDTRCAVLHFTSSSEGLPETTDICSAIVPAGLDCSDALLLMRVAPLYL